MRKYNTDKDIFLCWKKHINLKTRLRYITENTKKIAETTYIERNIVCRNVGSNYNISGSFKSNIPYVQTENNKKIYLIYTLTFLKTNILHLFISKK